MSVIASALKHMLAAGMPADAIVAAVAEMEASLMLDPVAEKRRAYDRERKRVSRSNVSTGHPPESTDISDKADTPLPSPSPFLPPNPQQTPTPAHPPVGNTPARKGTRLSDDWQPEPVIGPTAEMLERWPPGALERELEKFRNYWIAKPGKDAIKANWQRTWINWLLSADERIGRNERNQHHRPANDEIRDPMARAVLARQAERAARSASAAGGYAGDWSEID